MGKKKNNDLRSAFASSLKTRKEDRGRRADALFHKHLDSQAARMAKAKKQVHTGDLSVLPTPIMLKPDRRLSVVPVDEERRAEGRRAERRSNVVALFGDMPCIGQHDETCVDCTALNRRAEFTVVQ